MKAYIYNCHWLPSHIDAIVIYPFILTRYSHERMPRRLRKHEEKHIEQAHRYWIIGFYALYAWYYIKGRLWERKGHNEAYWDIPFEIEARGAE